ncbi:uncharacterized protein LOC129906508 [Episyrphus balteatus]|uniref:uncharacterized protein LOC129906508 n=1 Tax=Episyrphus balteatus TaxID=286459 RepID=UPI002485B6EB|nr:uncharacterized protein LOC129906508 [Episyrphus balteatus]
MPAVEDSQGAPLTYIIAQNSTVLARLMMENENRSINPSCYTTPASVFNTLAVDVDQDKSKISNNINPADISLKTTKIPASKLQKLDPTIEENISIKKTHPLKSDSLGNDSKPMLISTTLDSHLSSSSTLSSICDNTTSHSPTHKKILDPSTNKIDLKNNHCNIEQHFTGPSSKNVLSYTHNDHLTHQYVLDQKLQHNKIKPLQSSKICSLIRETGNINTLDLNKSLNAPENFERQPRTFYGSLERNQQVHKSVQQICMRPKGGSLERNQSVADVKNIFRNRTFRGGSLERNQQMNSYHSRSLECSYQMYRPPMDTTLESEQEGIYDFGGAKVKSCALSNNKLVSSQGGCTLQHFDNEQSCSQPPLTEAQRSSSASCNIQQPHPSHRHFVKRKENMGHIKTPKNTMYTSMIPNNNYIRTSDGFQTSSAPQPSSLPILRKNIPVDNSVPCLHKVSTTLQRQQEKTRQFFEVDASERQPFESGYKPNEQCVNKDIRTQIQLTRPVSKDQYVASEVDSEWFIHEEHAFKLTQEEIEQKRLKQQIESEIDSKWLIQEENALKKRLSLINSNTDSDTTAQEDNNSFSHANINRDWSQNSNNLNLTSRPSSPGCNTANQHISSSAPGTDCSTEASFLSKELYEGKNNVLESTKYQKLVQVTDRSNDEVYSATTSVVRAIMTLSQGVEKACAAEYLELVRYVGIELRSLLVSVDKLSILFPPQAHKEVEMAHQVLSKDMYELVSTMRLAQQYNETTLDVEYRKSMLSAAHVLAMDAKNLLDVIDSIRARYVFVNQWSNTQHSSFQTNKVVSDKLVQENDVPQKDNSLSQNYQLSSTLPLQPSHTNEEGYQIMSKDTSENSVSSQIRTNITNSFSVGCFEIYDNKCAINEHIRYVEPKSTISGSNDFDESLNDMVVRSSTKSFENIDTTNNSKESPNESLKIVEGNNHVYCNLLITSGTEQLVHN